MRPAPFTQRRRNFPHPKAGALDWSRVDYVAGLLAKGATVAPWGSDGRMGLSLDGNVVSTTSAAVLAAARDRGQEGML